MLNPFPLNMPKAFDCILEQQDAAVNGVSFISSFWDVSVHHIYIKGDTQLYKNKKRALLPIISSQ